MSAAPARMPASTARRRVARGIPTGQHLRRRGDEGEERRGDQHRRERAGVDLKPNSTKNNAANRSRSGFDERARSALHGARQRDSHQERADRRRHVELLGAPAASSVMPKHAEQERLVGARRDHAGEVMPEAERGDEREHGDRRPRWRSSATASSMSLARDHDGGDRQVDRHREVLEHEDS